MSKKIRYIVIHCSDSDWGTAIVINGWHQDNGWKMIGYHDVVLNGFPTYEHFTENSRDEMLDGTLECGRNLDPNGLLEEDEYGAHVKGNNSKSIGICVITKTGQLTLKQKETLINRIKYRMKQFNLGVQDVKGHYELDGKKTCPNFDMPKFREELLANIGIIKEIDKETKKSLSVKISEIWSNLFKFK